MHPEYTILTYEDKNDIQHTGDKLIKFRWGGRPALDTLKDGDPSDCEGDGEGIVS
jgi:hypothetical protein